VATARDHHGTGQLARSPPVTPAPAPGQRRG
jgi:hypothetical protein